MVEHQPRRDDGERPDLGDGSDGIPRWVKVFAVIAAIVILLFVTLLLIGSDHGPGRYMAPDGGGAQAPVAGAFARIGWSWP